MWDDYAISGDDADAGDEANSGDIAGFDVGNQKSASCSLPQLRFDIKYLLSRACFHDPDALLAL